MNPAGAGCTIYFDLVDQGFPYWHFLALGVALSAFGFILYASFSVFLERSRFASLYRGGALVFAVGWLGLTTFQTSRAFVHYRELVKAIQNGAVQTVQGRVTNFQPASELGRRIESFRVADKQFSYSPNDVEPGFNRTQDEGSPIRDGTEVEISYVNGVIVKLGMCKQ